MYFFKQQTAYELRISDWSSDVCSSYLVSIRDGKPSFELTPARPKARPKRKAKAGGMPKFPKSSSAAPEASGDRMSVDWGKRGSVRLDHGCGCIITKKKKLLEP